MVLTLGQMLNGFLNLKSCLNFPVLLHYHVLFLQDAYLPGEAPKPVKGVAQGGNLIAGIGQGISGAANGAASGMSGINGLKPSTPSKPKD